MKNILINMPTTKAKIKPINAKTAWYGFINIMPTPYSDDLLYSSLLYKAKTYNIYVKSMTIMLG